MSWGQLLGAAGALVVTVAIVETYNPRLALGLAVVTLLAIAFHNRQVLAELLALIGNQLPPHERT